MNWNFVGTMENSNIASLLILFRKAWYSKLQHWARLTTKDENHKGWESFSWQYAACGMMEEKDIEDNLRDAELIRIEQIFTNMIWNKILD